MVETTFYINGEFVKESDAKISILDLSVVRGYGVFDYMRTYQGRPFHLREHLNRLQFSCSCIGINLPCSLDKIETAIFELLRINNFPVSSIKIVVTGGISPDQFTPEDNSGLAIMVYPLKPFPSEWYSHGVRVITTSLQRPVPVSKTLVYLPAILALKEAKKQGAVEALYLNPQKEILEATTSNFFAFIGDMLVTPCIDEVLQGITREVVIRIAQEKYPLVERRIPYAEVPAFQEAFIVSSNKEIVPVTQIDDYIIGSGTPGPRTKELMKLFQSYTDSQSWAPLTITRYEQKDALLFAQ